jgi:HD-like signal output (HDOD) protein
MQNAQVGEVPDEERVAERRAATTHRLAKLPVFNQAATKLLTIALGDDDALAEFEAVFRSDPVLAAELLVQANSAEFGFLSTVSSIDHALSLLGLERTRLLASRIAMSLYLRSSSKPEVVAVWSHSLSAALLAEHIVRVARWPAPMAYTAALLHDLGSLGLLLTSYDQYKELIALQPTSVQEALMLEKVFFGIDHTEAGEFLADNWRFPDCLRTCFRDHHGSGAAHTDQLTRIVRISCGLAASMGFPEPLLRCVTGLPRAGLPPDLAARPEFAFEKLCALIAKNLSPAKD